jgi:metal-sulfur cluster biosynthetic enzyme
MIPVDSRLVDAPISVSTEQVLAELDQIIDPCAANAGVPIGIVSMGLVHDVRIKPGVSGAFVSLGITVTEPMCVMYHHFAIEADRRLRLLDGIADVSVAVLPYRMWTEENIAPAERDRLLSARQSRRPDPTSVAFPTTRPRL